MISKCLLCIDSMYSFTFICISCNKIFVILFPKKQKSYFYIVQSQLMNNQAKWLEPLPHICERSDLNPNNTPYICIVGI